MLILLYHRSITITPQLHQEPGPIEEVEKENSKLFFDTRESHITLSPNRSYKHYEKK